MSEDDPRAILAEAGVECAEVEAFTDLGANLPEQWWWDRADAAILALARLVAKYKRESEDYAESVDTWTEVSNEVCDELGIQYLVHAADRIKALKQDVAKYKNELGLCDLAHWQQKQDTEKAEWQRDEHLKEIRRTYEALDAEFGNWPPEAVDEYLADLERRWAEREA